MISRHLQALVCGLVLLLAAPLQAQVPATRAQYIQRIDIEGNRQVSDEKILRVLQLELGGPYQPKAIAEALERLFATRQFDDLRAYREQGTHNDSLIVTIEVSEYPQVDDVRYEGNDHVEDTDLDEEIGVTKGSFVRPALVRRDTDKISEIYKEKGYYRVSVNDTIMTDPESRQRLLVYQIDEGEKVSVQHVDFIGVHALDTYEVRGAMQLKQDAWWRGADFKPKEFEEDAQRITDLYRSYGFLDAQVLGHELVFSDDGRDLDIFITVSEGDQYFVGEIVWSGNDLFPDTAIANQITLRRGWPFDELELSRIEFNIGNKYWDRGYIYSTVSPVKHVRADTVDLSFEITQGNLAHVNEINITGNTKTAEYVIRRELVLNPGDVFAAARLRRSLREVFSLGFFAGPPGVTTAPANEQGDIDVTLRVEEKPAGQFRMGAGFSQLNRISGFIGVTEPNFLGRGLRVGIDWEFSRFRQNVNLQFTEPWLMGTPTELGLSVFARNQNQVNQQFFSDRRTGFSIRVGRPFPWLDYTSAFVRYSLEQVHLSDFSPLYNGPLELEFWPQMTSNLGITLIRNSTDNPFHPQFGSRMMLNARWTGGILGGDVNFQRYEADYKWYHRLLWKAVFQFRSNVGVLDPFDPADPVPDYELFRLGGNRRYALRGYDFFEVVPEGNQIFVGGRFFYIMGYEISYPIAPPTVYGSFFFDVGNTWNSFRDADPMNLRRGAGLGIRIELPMLGTVGMDYGYGFDRVGGGAWEPHITFGGAF